MPTHAGDARQQGLGASAKTVSEHLSSIVRLEIELATLELKRKVTALGVGIGLVVGALVVLVYMLGFALATVAAGLATAVAWWLALLIVAVALLIVAAVLALVGVRIIQTKATPPVPEQAIAEAKLTTDALKSDGAAT